MEEEEALRNYCRRMISVASNKQQQLEKQEEEKGREKTGTTGQVLAGIRGHGKCYVPFSDGTNRWRNLTSPILMSQGPEAQLAPLQLITMLRLKAFKEKMRRAAEVELHDPAVCSECEQKQAALALKTFIRRKKTQLQFQTLKGRLNTHMSYGESDTGGVRAKYSKVL
ncbi:uncharacterized protein LOC117260925 [Scomber scombrus]|uniref:Uncharacterized protein LOC117260925 n=1 Tax=Scomber scombrus TaxID=13677 RepID=A0AAV1PBA8_SCOSC